jgi:phage gpG-like protein
MWELKALGLPEVLEEISATADMVDDGTAFLSGPASVITGEAIRQNFLQGGRPDAWPDITARSRAQRKVNKTSGPLIDSGAMMDAASATRPGVEHSLYSVDGDTLTLGTDVVQAAVQQYGWEDKNIPARPYEDLQPEDELRLAAAYEGDYLHQMLANWD